MSSREKGYVLILVLVLLAVGSLLIGPLLSLAGTVLKSKQVITDTLMEQYARDGGAEYALWQLQYGTVTADLTVAGQEAHFQITLNGITPDVTIKLVAKPQEGGVTLATDDVIRPTKTVSPNSVPSEAFQTYTYSINLTQASTDTSQGLDAVYDIMPKDFDKCADSQSFYVTGSSFLDGVAIADPDCDDSSADEPILRWPATGSFTSPTRDFAESQVKVLTFQYRGKLKDNKVHCNWVVLMPWKTMSGREAPITVGTPTNPGCNEFESLAVSKTSDPEFIPPNTDIIVTYTVNIENTGDDGVDVERLTDYLPPGFTYCGPPAPDPAPPAGGTTDPDCQMPTGEIVAHPSSIFLETVNGVDRWRLIWDCAADNNCTGSGNSDEIDLDPGETRSFTFTAKTSQSSSGNFYNEILLFTDMEAKDAFKSIGLTDADFGGAVFSWTTGTVSVPAYDIRSSGGSAIAQGNALIDATGVTLNSWNVEDQ